MGNHCYTVTEFDEPLPENIVGAYDTTADFIWFFKAMFFFSFFCFALGMTFDIVDYCNIPLVEKKSENGNETFTVREKPKEIISDFAASIKKLKLRLLMWLVLEILQLVLLFKGSHMRKSYGG